MYENMTKFVMRWGLFVILIGVATLLSTSFLVLDSTPLSDPYKDIKDRTVTGYIFVQQPLNHILWITENERILGDVYVDMPTDSDQINFFEIKTIGGKKIYQESFGDHLMLDHSLSGPAGEYVFTISNNVDEKTSVKMVLGIPSTIHQKVQKTVLENQSFKSTIDNDTTSFIQFLGLTISGMGIVITLYESRNKNIIKKIFVRDSNSLPLIFAGIVISILSFVLLFTINGFGLILTLVILGIGGSITIIGLIKNSKLNKMKTGEEKFVEKLEKINQLPIEDRQKSLKKLFWRSSAVLFLDVGITLHIWREFYHSFDAEFLFSYPFDFTIILSAICFAIAGIYTLKMKKLGAIFGISANMLMVSSIVLYYVYGGELNLWIAILKAGTGVVAFRLAAAYKYLK